MFPMCQFCGYKYNIAVSGGGTPYTERAGSQEDGR
jgi:hypothetical protein